MQRSGNHLWTFSLHHNWKGEVLLICLKRSDGVWDEDKSIYMPIGDGELFKVRSHFFIYFYFILFYFLFFFFLFFPALFILFLYVCNRFYYYCNQILIKNILKISVCFHITGHKHFTLFCPGQNRIEWILFWTSQFKKIQKTRMNLHFKLLI